MSQATIDDERAMTGAPLGSDQADELADLIEERLRWPRGARGSRSVGAPIRRYGGDDRVTGHQKFLSDLHFTDAAQVALVTLPVGCATITGIDVARAAGCPV